MCHLRSLKWYPGLVGFKLYDSDSTELAISDNEGLILLSAMATTSDPRVSGCIECRSCVVATDPMAKLVDNLDPSVLSNFEHSEDIIGFLDETESIHVYFWEENDCIHRLWRDPLAAQWSKATGEKRLR